jgi:hypothetical protein
MQGQSCAPAISAKLIWAFFQTPTNNWKLRKTGAYATFGTGFRQFRDIRIAKSGHFGPHPCPEKPSNPQHFQEYVRSLEQQSLIAVEGQTAYKMAHGKKFEL